MAYDIKTICLGALSFGDATGYEIRKTINTDYAHFAGASIGGLYPALGGLLAKKLVESRDNAAKSVDRKVYAITDAGRAAFVEQLKATDGVEVLRSDFLASMYFARHLDVEDLRALAARRLADLHGEVRALRQLPSVGMTEGERFTVRYALAIRQAAISFLEGEGRAIVNAEERAHYRS